MTYTSRRWTIARWAPLLLVAAALPLHAQTAAQGGPAPDANPAVTGSESVFVNGKPALRAGDQGEGAVEIVPDVIINGKPAVVCANGSKSGSANVFIHGKPQARAGDCK